MEWPQIIILILLCLRLYVHADRHGEKKHATYDFFGAAVYVIIQVILLYFGGFWK